MVSDQEIIACVLRHLALIGSGQRSVASAGEACFAELMAEGRKRGDGMFTELPTEPQS